MDYFAPAVQLGITATPKHDTTRTWTPTAISAIRAPNYCQRVTANDGALATRTYGA